VTTEEYEEENDQFSSAPVASATQFGKKNNFSHRRQRKARARV